MKTVNNKAVSSNNTIVMRSKSTLTTSSSSINTRSIIKKNTNTNIKSNSNIKTGVTTKATVINNKRRSKSCADITRKPLIPSNTTNSNTTNNTTNNTTTTTKKIPPYDYKARYMDLVERHKPLKQQLNTLTQEHQVLLDKINQYNNTDQQIILLKELCNKQEKNIETLQKQRLCLIHKYDKEVEERRNLKQKLKDVQFQLHENITQLEDINEQLQLANNDREQLTELTTKQTKDIQEYKDSIERLHWERRDLHNKIQDMKGNIRVICRVRPALAPDRPVALVKFPDACTIELERLESGNRQRLVKYDFKFDRVFGPCSHQDDVWEEVSCLIQSAIDGYNVCIFAYGQTGSGKTYTMEGNNHSPGIIPKTCTMLFESIKQMSKSGWEYKVYASFLEIYNEQLYDLLEPNRDPRELDIRMVDAKGTDVYVTNMREEEVNNAIDLLHLCARAAQRRQTAATASNERSSRSHSVSRIKLVAYHKDKSQQLQARLCLVDLAGSESAKLSGRIEETKNINRSLSELGQVILALQQKKDHVPFRNSKLTRLLEPQLGGAAKALLVAAAAPYQECSHETLNTFRFATQVGNCSTAAARRNIALANPTAQNN